MPFFSYLGFRNLRRLEIFKIVRYSTLTYVLFSTTITYKVPREKIVFLLSLLFSAPLFGLLPQKTDFVEKDPQKWVFFGLATAITLRDGDRLRRLNILSCSTTLDLSRTERFPHERGSLSGVILVFLIFTTKFALSSHRRSVGVRLLGCVVFQRRKGFLPCPYIRQFYIPKTGR